MHGQYNHTVTACFVFNLGNKGVLCVAEFAALHRTG
jgi:hypothetical protein